MWAWLKFFARALAHLCSTPLRILDTPLCWSFFADNMASFTLAEAYVVPCLADQVDPASQDSSGANLVQAFVGMLARAVQNIDAYQVKVA